MSAHPPTPTRLLNLNNTILQYPQSPRTIRNIIGLFYHFLGHAHREPDASDDRITLFWEAIVEKSPAYQAIKRDSYIRHIEIYKELAANCHLLNGLPDEELRRGPPSGNDVQFRGYAASSRGRDWLVLCAWSTTPALPYHILAWLKKIYDLQPRMLPPAYHAFMDPMGWQLSDTPTNLAVAYSYRINDYDAIIHMQRFVLRQAMTVADIWAYCPITEREGYSLMPNYKWYYGGLRVMGAQIMQEIEDAFSQYPYRVREQLKVISWARLYEHLWELASTASHWIDPDSYPYLSMRLSRNRIRFRMYRRILDDACRSFTAPDTPIRRLIRDAFGCDWQLNRTVYAGSYAIVEAECAVDLEYMRVNCKTPSYLRAGLGIRFYSPLQDDPRPRTTARIVGLGDDRSDTDSERSAQDSAPEPDDGLGDLTEARLEAYGPRHDLSSFCFNEQPRQGDICTVCQEDFSSSRFVDMLVDDRRCVFTEACQHGFHAECIAEWVNGTAVNRDRCPECRGQIVEWKRAVRPQ